MAGWHDAKDRLLMGRTDAKGTDAKGQEGCNPGSSTLILNSLSLSLSLSLTTHSLSLSLSHSRTLVLTHSLSLSHSHTHILTHSLTATHTHSHALPRSHSLSLTHTLSRSLSLSLSLSRSLRRGGEGKCRCAKNKCMFWQTIAAVTNPTLGPAACPAPMVGLLLN